MKNYKAWVKNDFYNYDKEIKQYLTKWHMVNVQILYVNKNKIRGGWVNKEGKKDAREFTDFILIEPIGLKDVNGNEVYEGDILQDEAGLGVVKWVQEHCSFLVYVSDLSGYYLLESDGQLTNSEVVGNIYENRDLLSN